MKAYPSSTKIYSTILLTLAVFTQAHADAHKLVGMSIHQACQIIIQHKTKRGVAYLIDPNGKISEGPIDLGDIRSATLSTTTEFSPFPTRYRVVISSPRYVQESRLNLTATQLKPTCTGTVEYSLTAAIDLFRSSPGEIGGTMDIDETRFFYDGKADYPIPPEYRFKFSVVGTLLSPKPELIEDHEFQQGVDRLLTGKSHSLSLTLKNTGNESLVISDLVDIATLSDRKAPYAILKKARDECADSSSEASEICTLQIQKKWDDCIGRPLPPGGACNIELKRISESPLPRGAVYVLNIHSNYKLGYNPRIQLKLDTQGIAFGELKRK